MLSILRGRNYVFALCMYHIIMVCNEGTSTDKNLKLKRKFVRSSISLDQDFEPILVSGGIVKKSVKLTLRVRV